MCVLITFINVLVDPEFLQLSPSMMDQQESLKGTSDQKDNIYEDSDIEAIVHNIFSSKFQEVFSFSLH